MNSQNRVSTDPLETQKKAYSEAYQLMSSAITMEENLKKSASKDAQAYNTALQIYQRAMDLLHGAQRIEFPPEQWIPASELQAKIWKTFQMAAMRVRELQNSMPKNMQVQNPTPQSTPQNQSVNLNNVVDTIAKINLGSYSQEGMRRQDQIDAHRNKAQEVVKAVTSTPVQPHLGLPNNVGELTDLIAEASLLPKPGVPKQLQEHMVMKGLEQFKKTQFFINALAQEPKRKWERINWFPTLYDAKIAAQEYDRPIFLEIIVGRYGEKESTVC